MTATLDQLRAALARVDAATGPMKIPQANAVADMLYPGDTRDAIACWELVTTALRGGIEALGAVIALVEREMPEVGWSLYTETEKRFSAIIWVDEGKFTAQHQAERKSSPTLALLAAFLRAKIAEAKQAPENTWDSSATPSSQGSVRISRK